MDFAAGDLVAGALFVDVVFLAGAVVLGAVFEDGVVVVFVPAGGDAWPAGVTLALLAASCACAAHTSVESTFAAGSFPALTNVRTGSQSHAFVDARSAECPFLQCRTSDD